MTTELHDAGPLEGPHDDLDAVLDLVDTDPVPLAEVDLDGDYEQRAAEHLGLDDPHDEEDVLAGVEVDDREPSPVS